MLQSYHESLHPEDFPILLKSQHYIRLLWSTGTGDSFQKSLENVDLFLLDFLKVQDFCNEYLETLPENVFVFNITPYSGFSILSVVWVCEVVKKTTRNQQGQRNWTKTRFTALHSENLIKW